MLGTAVHNTITLIANLLLDLGLLTAVLSINSIDDMAVAVKIIVSLLVALISFVRFFYYIKDRRNNGKGNSKST